MKVGFPGMSLNSLSLFKTSPSSENSDLLNNFVLNNKFWIENIDKDFILKNPILQFLMLIRQSCNRDFFDK